MLPTLACSRLDPSRRLIRGPARPTVRLTFLLVFVGIIGVMGGILPAAVRPNFVVIFTDDHGYTDLGSQKIARDLKTPRLDALAESGLRMTSGYVTAPQCVPSRGGLLTGRYQNRFGLETNKQPLTGFNQQQTVAARLQRAGYATGMIGKWHLGPIPEIARHGFNDVFAKNSARPGWANFTLAGEDRKGGPEPTKLYHLDACSRAAEAFINRHRDQPFFLYVAYRAPHVPLDAPRKYLDRFPGKMPERRRQALAMLSAVDDGVGRIVETLRQHKLDRRTMIFVIGDNGAPLKIHKLDAPGGGPGWDGSLNEPLNGEKGMLTEGGIRVPFLVSWPGTIPGGRTYDQAVISLDVAATAVAAAGVDAADAELDGVDLLPYLKGDRDGAPHDALFWRWSSQAAVRVGRWKYLRGGAREYLFDLNEDKEERRNLLKQHPERARELAERLSRWASELQPPGMTAGGAATAWQRYFDYYLDGKPAPPIPSAAASSKSTKLLLGWVARNSLVKPTADRRGISVRSTVGRKRPFLAHARLELPTDVTLSATLRCKHPGTAGWAWRTAGQKDFAADQIVHFRCGKTEQWQTHALKLPARGKVIHVRLVLPAAGVDVADIVFRDAQQKVIREWHFGGQKDGAK